MLRAKMAQRRQGQIERISNFSRGNPAWRLTKPNRNLAWRLTGHRPIKIDQRQADDKAKLCIATQLPPRWTWRLAVFGECS